MQMKIFSPEIKSWEGFGTLLLTEGDKEVVQENIK